MYDLIIIGGGINGVALARLSAHHNKKVLLLEKHDLSKGASGNSSKLIHGGLRYLEHFEFDLITEATIERDHLYKIAPHLVVPKRFYFPFTPSTRQHRFAVKVGLSLYENLAQKNRWEKHTWLSKAELRELEPEFTPYQKGAYFYSDAQTDDTRLVTENAISAHEKGAEIRTYCEYLSMSKEDQVITVKAKDRLLDSPCAFKTKKVAFCTGSWSNEVLTRKNHQLPKPVLPSQGTHLFVENLPLKNPFILPVPKSKRFFFALPWLHGTLIGTTEHSCPENHDLVTPTIDEIEELQGLIFTFFPESKPKGICAIAGIRPLAKSGKSTIKASRKHKFISIDQNVFALVGGKFTTYRSLAELYFQYIGFELETGLEDERLPGARSWTPEVDPKDLVAPPLKESPHLGRWFKTYGMRLKDLGVFITENADINPVLAESLFCKKHEFTQSPIDFLRRRSNLFFSSSAGLEFMASLSQQFPDPPQGTWSEHYFSLLKASHHVASKNST